jgi:hypothetical protein
MQSATRQALRDLLDRLAWPAVEAALAETYPEEAERMRAYQAVYETRAG